MSLLSGDPAHWRSETLEGGVCWDMEGGDSRTGWPRVSDPWPRGHGGVVSGSEGGTPVPGAGCEPVQSSPSRTLSCEPQCDPRGGSASVSSLTLNLRTSGHRDAQKRPWRTARRRRLWIGARATDHRPPHIRTLLLQVCLRVPHGRLGDTQRPPPWGWASPSPQRPAQDKKAREMVNMDTQRRTSGGPCSPGSSS